MDKISIIVSAYNEEEALPLFYPEMCRVAEMMPDVEFEMIFVDDGSKDNTLHILRDFHRQDERVRYISFSRNFGKEAAMYAGLKASTGDFVAFLDADLQDPPALLPEMYQTLKEEDYDSVATRRETRTGEPRVRSWFARRFYQIINSISDADIVDGARDYRLMKRVMVDAILQMSEHNRFSKGIFGWVGFKTKWIAYDNIERVAGNTKWSFWKLLIYALNGIVAFSTVPLMIPMYIGILTCGVSFIYTIVKLITGTGLSVYGCLFFMMGMLFVCLGIIASYLSKIYADTLDRPVYIVRETERGIK